MTQPDFVPNDTRFADDRLAQRLPAPEGWFPARPGELPAEGQPEGRHFGNVGPDQGYALKLAKQFVDRLVLDEGEHAADAVAGCLGVALKRAALFGRAPVIYDLELAFTLWGFLGDAPTELIAARRRVFDSASHHYWEQRDIADAVPESTLRMKPDEVRARLCEWDSLLQLQPH